MIDIPPNNVPLENIHVPPENIIPPPPPPPRNHHHFSIIPYIFYVCFLILFVLSISAYTYMKYNSQKVVLHPFTANIIGFKPNGSREPLNVSFSYLFYNPNSILNLDVLNGTADVYFGSHGRLSTSIHQLSLQPRQHKDVDFIFPHFRLRRYVEDYYFKLTVKVRTIVYFRYIPISVSSSIEQTCHLHIEGQFSIRSVPVPVKRFSCHYE